MRVNNNIYAQNAYRHLTNTSGSLGKSLEKLSSGLRINRAADDAADLGVSEKLRSQVSGLQVAIDNSQDGIAVIQTAEGALDRTHTILRRIRDLTESAANGDKTDDDRAKYQAEVDQLLDEIDRISTTTEYNTKKLLNGALGATVTDDLSKLATSAAAKNANLISNVSITGSPAKTGVYTIELASDITSTGSTRHGNTDFATGESFAAIVNDPSGTSNLSAAFGMSDPGGETETLTFSQPGFDKEVSVTLSDSDSINEALTKIQTALDQGGLQIDVRWDNNEGLANGLNVGSADDNGGFVFEARGRGADYNFFVSGQNSTGTTKIVSNDADNGGLTENTDTDLVYEGNGAGIDAVATEDLFQFLVTNPDGTSQTIVSQSSVLKADTAAMDSAITVDNQGYYQGIVGMEIKMNLDDPTLSMLANSNKVGVDVSGIMTFQAGPNKGEDHRISVAINDMGAAALGISGLDISTQESAQKLIDAESVDGAIRLVSEQRGQLGALQNRLEHTIKNLSVTKENLSSSESRIRDTDMAKEMAEFTKSQILQQAGTAMLAQANSINQSVLQLLG